MTPAFGQVLRTVVDWVLVMNISKSVNELWRPSIMTDERFREVYGPSLSCNRPFFSYNYLR